MEPFYIAQTAEPRTSQECMAWFEAQRTEANAEGGRFYRFTIATPFGGGCMALMEGWREKHVPDQGEPRWQLTAG